MELVEYLVFRLRIQGAGRFIENNDVGFTQERPRQSNLLPLADTQFLAIGKPFPKQCVIARWQAHDRLMRPRLLCRIDNALFVRWNLDIAEPDILFSRKMVLGIFLKHDAEVSS